MPQPKPRSLPELYEDWRKRYIYAHVKPTVDPATADDLDPEPYYKAADVVRFYNRCPPRLFKQMRSSLMILCTAEKLHNEKARQGGLFNRCLNATAVKELLDEYNLKKTPEGNWRTLGWF